MKHFACGDVVGGCTAVFVGDTTDEILVLVAQHARTEHNMIDLPAEFVAAVRGTAGAAA